MSNYSKTWTQFETQSLAFGLLRKGLFPKYLVRGDLGVIDIYRPTADHKNPEKLLTIHVSATDSSAQSGFYESPLGPKHYVLAGGDMAWKVVELVTPLI
jgi:hypothetical protein